MLEIKVLSVVENTSVDAPEPKERLRIVQSYEVL